MSGLREIDVETDRIGTEIVDAAFQIHSTLGPGLLESVYEACMARELELRGLHFDRQTPVPVEYRGVQLPTGFRLDLRVENRVIIELKAVDQILPIHRAQLITYLKLTGCQLGYLINFNTPVIKNGIRCIALTSD